MPGCARLFVNEIMHRPMRVVPVASLESRRGNLHLKCTRASRMPVEGAVRGGGGGEWSPLPHTSGRSAHLGGSPGATAKELS